MAISEVVSVGKLPLLYFPKSHVSVAVFYSLRHNLSSNIMAQDQESLTTDGKKQHFKGLYSHCTYALFI
jgi:hypothetical protein